MTGEAAPDALLRRFAGLYPFQPATAFFRAVEVAILVEAGLPAGRGLDLGCGDGKLTGVVLELAGDRRMTGVDADPDEAELARKSAIYETVHPSPGEDVPEPDRSFDFVISNSTLEHIDGIGETLDEVARLLKPGGRFMFTVPSEGFHECLRGPLLSSDRDGYLRRTDERNAHLRYWPPERWRRELERRDLRVEAVTRYLTREQVRRWETLHRLTGGLLSRISGSKPIEIQKRAGVRSQARPLPARFATGLARMLSIGVDLDAGPRPGEPSGCLLVVASK